MLVKIVTLFLVFMAVLAMLGRLRMPKIGNKLGLKRPAKCRACGAFLVNDAPCPCGGNRRGRG